MIEVEVSGSGRCERMLYIRDKGTVTDLPLLPSILYIFSYVRRLLWDFNIDYPLKSHIKVNG